MMCPSFFINLNASRVQIDKAIMFTYLFQMLTLLIKNNSG